MENQNNMNNGAMLAALGYPVALPQTVEQYPTYKYSVQRTQYDPQKMAALKLALATKRDMQPLKDALAKPRPVMSAGEAIANALAQYPEARSYTGGFGEEIISPWAEGLSSFARGFGTVYGARKASEREAAQQAREDAIKAAQLDVEAAEKDRDDAIKAAQLELDADKRVVNAEQGLQWIKKNVGSANAAEKEAEQRKAAVAALHELDDLAENGNIWSLNKSTDSALLTGTASQNIGRRDQALSTLVPMTAKVAHDAGISGINSVGEAMLYLGIPENATSKQIKGALPGMVKKLGLEKEFYNTQPAQPVDTNARPLPQVGQIVDGYEFLGGDPADAKNWRAK